MADLDAQIAANDTGVREVGRMIETSSGSTWCRPTCAMSRTTPRHSVRRVIGRLKDGAFTYPTGQRRRDPGRDPVDHAGA